VHYCSLSDSVVVRCSGRWVLRFIRSYDRANILFLLLISVNICSFPRCCSWATFIRHFIFGTTHLLILNLFSTVDLVPLEDGTFCCSFRRYRRCLGYFVWNVPNFFIHSVLLMPTVSRCPCGNCCWVVGMPFRGFAVERLVTYLFDYPHVRYHWWFLHSTFWVMMHWKVFTCWTLRCSVVRCPLLDAADSSLFSLRTPLEFVPDDFPLFLLIVRITVTLFHHCCLFTGGIDCYNHVYLIGPHLLLLPLRWCLPFSAVLHHVVLGVSQFRCVTTVYFSRLVVTDLVYDYVDWIRCLFCPSWWRVYRVGCVGTNTVYPFPFTTTRSTRYVVSFVVRVPRATVSLLPFTPRFTLRLFACPRCVYVCCRSLPLPAGYRYWFVFRYYVVFLFATVSAPVTPFVCSVCSSLLGGLIWITPHRFLRLFIVRCWLRCSLLVLRTITLFVLIWLYDLVRLYTGWLFISTLRLLWNVRLTFEFGRLRCSTFVVTRLFTLFYDYLGTLFCCCCSLSSFRLVFGVEFRFLHLCSLRDSAICRFLPFRPITPLRVRCILDSAVTFVDSVLMIVRCCYYRLFGWSNSDGADCWRPSCSGLPHCYSTDSILRIILLLEQACCGAFRYGYCSLLIRVRSVRYVTLRYCSLGAAIVLGIDCLFVLRWRLRACSVTDLLLFVVLLSLFYTNTRCRWFGSVPCTHPLLHQNTCTPTPPATTHDPYRHPHVPTHSHRPDYTCCYFENWWCHVTMHVPGYYPRWGGGLLVGGTRLTTTYRWFSAICLHACCSGHAYHSHFGGWWILLFRFVVVLRCSLFDSVLFVRYLLTGDSSFGCSSPFPVGTFVVLVTCSWLRYFTHDTLRLRCLFYGVVVLFDLPPLMGTRICDLIYHCWWFVVLLPLFVVSLFVRCCSLVLVCLNISRSTGGPWYYFSRSTFVTLFLPLPPPAVLRFVTFVTRLLITVHVVQTFLRCVLLFAVEPLRWFVPPTAPVPRSILRLLLGVASVVAFVCSWVNFCGGVEPFFCVTVHVTVTVVLRAVGYRNRQRRALEQRCWCCCSTYVPHVVTVGTFYDLPVVLLVLLLRWYSPIPVVRYVTILRCYVAFLRRVRGLNFVYATLPHSHYPAEFPFWRFLTIVGGLHVRGVVLPGRIPLTEDYIPHCSYHSSVGYSWWWPFIQFCSYGLLFGVTPSPSHIPFYTRWPHLIHAFVDCWFFVRFCVRVLSSTWTCCL